jgi:hypothetical protein
LEPISAMMNGFSPEPIFRPDGRVIMGIPLGIQSSDQVGDNDDKGVILKKVRTVDQTVCSRSTPGIERDLNPRFGRQRPVLPACQLGPCPGPLDDRCLSRT